MLGFGPFYWIWRVFGIDEWTSLQLWIITVFVLNYVVSLWVLRKCTSANLSIITPAAFFIAFGYQRNIGHLQMIPLFYMLIAFLAIFQLFRKRENATDVLSQKQVWLWLSLFFSCCLLQAYAAVYNPIFFTLYLILALLFTLFRKKSRLHIWSILKTIWKPLAVWNAISIIALIPIAHHYLLTYADLGGRDFNPESGLSFASLVSFKKSHWLYGFTEKWPKYYLHRGIGFVTLAVSLYGLILLWKKKNGYFLILPALLTVLLGMNIFGFNLWTIPHHAIPIFKAIRSEERIYIMTLIPISFGMVWALETLSQKKKIGLCFLIGVVCIAEHYHPLRFSAQKEYLRSHVENLASKIDPTCDAFYLLEEDGNYDPKLGYRRKQTKTEDAEWAALLSGVPTINGRYGNYPVGYEQLKKYTDITKKDMQLIQSEVQKWINFHGKSHEKICIIAYPRLKFKVKKEEKK